MIIGPSEHSVGGSNGQRSGLFWRPFRPTALGRLIPQSCDNLTGLDT